MGYTKDFTGEFTVTPALDAAQVAYLAAFNKTRRMQRDEQVTVTRPDPVRDAVGLPVGPQGGYFVGAGGGYGQEDGDRKSLGIVDYNQPPTGQPGLWCQWEPSADGGTIAWDGGEKFYDYVEWLEYLVENFLKPWGRVLSGEVTWSGEDEEDRGKIVVRENKVSTLQGRTVYS